ncbi:MAG: hypothetical protein H7138_20900 [Myxococcales bacterium]|nr:hypothetical protein [Myxococcales bacterium]
MASMKPSRASILLILASGALGACVSDAHGGDPDLDSDSAARRRPAPDPSPGPDNACTPVGGPSTLGARLDEVEYEVTGGPNALGNGTSLDITEIGWMTLHTADRGVEEGWIDGLAHYGLARRATSAELPTLCAMYSCDGCENDYVHNLSVWFNDIRYTVRASFRATPPDRLTALISYVQNLSAHPLQ